MSYCGHTRRVGVGAKNGNLAVYDLKQNKCQVFDDVFLAVWVLSCTFLSLGTACYALTLFVGHQEGQCLFVRVV